MEFIRFFENDKTALRVNVKRVNALIKQLSPKAKWVSWKRLQEIMEHGIIFTALDCNEDIIGIATLTMAHKPTGFFGTMEDVVVQKKHRRKGIGRKLVSKLKRRAKQLGMAYVDFTSNPKRAAANALYLKMGAEKRETNIYRFKL